MSKKMQQDVANIGADKPIPPLKKHTSATKKGDNPVSIYNC